MITVALILAFLLITTLMASSSGWSNVLSADRNELVFAERNRAYGAYRMRREYNRTMVIALFAGLGLVGGITLLPMLLRGDDTVVTSVPQVKIEDEILKVVEVIIPKSVQDPGPRPPAPRPSAPATAAGPLLAIDSVASTPLDTTSSAPSPTPDPGPGGGKPDPGPIKGDGGGTGTTNGGVKDGWELESLPEYPGGETALHRYLMREVRYPSDAIDARQEGRVTVGFIIRSDGAVTDVKVLKGISPSIDAEAIRVVKAMIKWIPGKFNQREVDVRYALPILFKLKS